MVPYFEVTYHFVVGRERQVFSYQLGYVITILPMVSVRQDWICSMVFVELNKKFI